jgi:hypothetical protein
MLKPHADSTTIPRELRAPARKYCSCRVAQPNPYERYALASNRGTSNIATYRSIVRKYPERDPSQILRDLVAATPGEEGQWFATAKEAGELELAARFANQSPCDPRTLTRAVRDFVDKNPEFALQAGLAAIRWLAQGTALRSPAPTCGRRTRIL